MIRTFFFLTKSVFLAGLLVCLSIKALYAENATEQLIVFMQPNHSVIDRTFKERYLEKIAEIAKDENVDLLIRSVDKGAPAEVTITPLIVFQNYKGRSIYQGRTTTTDRIRNFIRTCRYIPQQDIPNIHTNTFIWHNERTHVWAPIKISDVTGTKPDHYDSKAFKAESQKAIAQGFSKFKLIPRIDLLRSDRGFYMDFYPWLSKDGTLFLSLALFSQFHCKQPIYKTQDKPLTGPWKKRQKLFKKAAHIMEQQVLKHIQDTEIGDGFTPVSVNTPETSWAQIGLDLPARPASETVSTDMDVKIPKQWKLAIPGPHDPALVLFRFPAPLDNYSGQITRGNGRITLTDTNQINGAKGFVKIDMTSITMGEPDLDHALNGSMILKTKSFPTASFTLDKLEGPPLEFGQLIPATVSGDFFLKGKTIPLQLTMEAEPVLTVDRKLQVLVRGGFKIDLRTFNIEGAQGPDPQRFTLLIDLNLIWEPDSSK